MVINGVKYARDAFTNVPTSILEKIPAQIYKAPDHPLTVLKEKIISHLSMQSPCVFKVREGFHPVVSTTANFDSLLFPKDHPGRSQSDTYYINKDNVLRTHTSAHQMEVLRSKESLGYLLTSDVYRRDQIDATHYPVFHQMEGIRLFSDDEIKSLLKKWNAAEPKQALVIDETTIGPSNPKQDIHSEEQCQVVVKELKSTLEGLFRHLFSHEKDLKIRWIEGYFPFTSPSYEMEVFYQGEWLELCGCGVIQQKILDDSGNQEKVGWAFGLGLERIAMFLYQIPDIRLFWSQDPRFTSQFSRALDQKQQRMLFKPFSKYPVCYKDISYWCPENYHENDLHEIVRSTAGDIVEDVRLVRLSQLSKSYLTEEIDTFVHPKSKRTSRCYRINYRSMERTLQNEEIDVLQDKIVNRVIKELGVEVR